MRFSVPFGILLYLNFKAEFYQFVVDSLCRGSSCFVILFWKDYEQCDKMRQRGSGVKSGLECVMDIPLLIIDHVL